MNIMEIWKDIKGYEGLYQVSNEGRVKSLDRIVKNKLGTQFVEGRLLKQFVDKSGYSHVALCNSGIIKNKTIHRLVAEAFIENPNNLPCVDHIQPVSEGGTNCVENLHWCTHKDNSNNPNTKKRMIEWSNTEKNKKRVSEQFKGEKNPNYFKKGIPNAALSKSVYQYTLDNKLVNVWESTNECGRNEFNQAHVSDCCIGKRKTHKGYKWSYVPL